MNSSSSRMEINRLQSSGIFLGPLFFWGYISYIYSISSSGSWPSSWLSISSGSQWSLSDSMISENFLIIIWIYFIIIVIQLQNFIYGDRDFWAISKFRRLWFILFLNSDLNLIHESLVARSNLFHFGHMRVSMGSKYIFVGSLLSKTTHGASIVPMYTIYNHIGNLWWNFVCNWNFIWVKYVPQKLLLSCSWAAHELVKTRYNFQKHGT